MMASTSDLDARLQKFRATPEAEARLLILVDAFSRRGKRPRELEGRVKLAKLDFLLRYPSYMARILELRDTDAAVTARVLDIQDLAPIDSRMMRYRYGPWDPSYYALLGALLGRNLIESIPLPGRNGFGYRTNSRGAELAARISEDESFQELAARALLLRRHLDLSGTALKALIYRLPEISNANWREELI